MVRSWFSSYSGDSNVIFGEFDNKETAEKYKDFLIENIDLQFVLASLPHVLIVTMGMGNYSNHTSYSKTYEVSVGVPYYLFHKISDEFIKNIHKEFLSKQ